jgi:hypothetical protein
MCLTGLTRLGRVAGRRRPGHGVDVIYPKDGLCFWAGLTHGIGSTVALAPIRVSELTPVEK